MQTIKVTVPKEGKKWKASFGKGSPLLRNNATVIYNAIERRLLASRSKDKTRLFVNYHQVGGFHNEGVYSDTNEALYVLACFLEDYLSSSFALSKYKKYYPKFTGEKYITGGE